MKRAAKNFYQFFNTFWGSFIKVFIPALGSQIAIAQMNGVDIYTMDAKMWWRLGITALLSLIVPITNAANPMDARYGRKSKPEDFKKEPKGIIEP